MLNSAQMNLNAKVSVQSIQYYPFQWLHLQPNADAILFKVRYICIKSFDELICKTRFSLPWCCSCSESSDRPCGTVCYLYIYTLNIYIYICIFSDIIYLYIYNYTYFYIYIYICICSEPSDRPCDWDRRLQSCFKSQSTRWSLGFIFSSYNNLKLYKNLKLYQFDVVYQVMFWIYYSSSYKNLKL